MVTEAEIQQITHLQVPTRYAFRKTDGTLEVTSVAEVAVSVEATVIPFRSRGPNFRPL